MDYLIDTMAPLADKQKASLMVIAHNFKGYDGHFILQDIFERTLTHKPELIMTGTKLTMIQLGNIKFLDSLNMFQIALAKVPAAFGFSTRVIKGYFPYKFNVPNIWDYNGPIPDITQFGSFMSPEREQDLCSWSQSNGLNQATTTVMKS